MPGNILPRLGHVELNTIIQSDDNPYKCYVSASVAGTRQAAKNMSKGYILSSGGGYTAMVPSAAFVQSPVQTNLHTGNSTVNNWFSYPKGPTESVG